MRSCWDYQSSHNEAGFHSLLFFSLFHSFPLFHSFSLQQNKPSTRGITPRWNFQRIEGRLSSDSKVLRPVAPMLRVFRVLRVFVVGQMSLSSFSRLSLCLQKKERIFFHRRRILPTVEAELYHHKMRVESPKLQLGANPSDEDFRVNRIDGSFDMVSTCCSSWVLLFRCSWWILKFFDL